MILGISKNSNTDEMLTHLMALSYQFLVVTKMARWRGRNELLLDIRIFCDQSVACEFNGPGEELV